MTKEAGTPPDLSGRRPLLKAAAGGAVALGAVGIASRVALHPGDRPQPAPGGPALVLSGQGENDVRSLDLRLGDSVLPRVGRDRWESRQLPTSVHSMVAFTWGVDQQAPVIWFRSRTDGRWQPWRTVPQLHDAPDPDSAEASEVTGTDLVWIGDSDAIQIALSGRRPADLTLVLLHPGRRAGETSFELAPRAEADTGEDATERVAMPRMFTRRDWGADESLRGSRPSYNHTIKQLHVHHTVNSNSYARADVPGLIRGMYRYHTHNLGWSDIGYNFLVDRYGRIWVGRAGGARRAVRGAHTLGFNHSSTGVSVIGNFETTSPGSAVLDAVASLGAWKLGANGRNPRGEIRVTSEGSDRFPSGRTVRLPVIDGHRDTNETACPGRYLYAALPSIRRRAARKLRRSRTSEIVAERRAAVTGATVFGQQLTADAGDYRPGDARVSYQWLRDGKRLRGAHDRTYTCRGRDVGARISCRVVLARQGYESLTQEPGGGTVTAESGVALRLRVRRGRLKVGVRVSRPEGVRATPGGAVTVRVGGRSKTVRLVNGTASVRFRGRGRRGRLPAGRYRVVASYAGDGAFSGSRTRKRIRID